MLSVADVTCLGCGCLCDDIEAGVSDGRIVEARNACELGHAWFLADRGRADRPIATVGGLPVDAALAIAEAADILRAARSPIVLGLTGTTMETQGLAVALADRLGAAISPAHEAIAAPRIGALRRVGMVSATLGEVKNRADLVIFWGVDPLVTHPRHWERYSVDPAGRFVPKGRADRTVIVVDRAPTSTAERADLFLQIPAENQFEALTSLRAAVKGLDAIDVESPLRFLADRMKTARYGAFLLRPEPRRYGDGGSRPHPGARPQRPDPVRRLDPRRAGQPRRCRGRPCLADGLPLRRRFRGRYAPAPCRRHDRRDPRSRRARRRPDRRR